MKRRVVSLFLFFFLVSTALVSAATVQDIALFQGEPGEEIEIIGPARKTVELRFTVLDPDPNIPIQIDLSQFYTIGNDLASRESRQEWVDVFASRYVSNINVKTDYCTPILEEATHSGYSCEVTDIKLRTNPADGQIPISFFVGEQITDAITLSIDEENPTVLRLITNHCTNEACYVGVGVENTITLEASDNHPLIPSNVRYTIDGVRETFKSCEGTTCTRDNYIQRTCTSGDEFRVIIDGTDAHGNSFVQSSQDFIVICDELTPQIREIDLGTPPLPFPNYKNGDEVVITARISEDISGISAKADLSALQGVEPIIGEDGEEQTPDLTPGACQRLDTSINEYECVWRATAVAGTHEVSFTFEDNAGHVTFPETRTIIVDEYDIETTTEELDLFRDITAQPNSPRGYSRLGVSIAIENQISYPIFVNFEPVAKQSLDGIEILKTQTSVTSCAYINDSQATSAGRVLDTIAVRDEFFDYANDDGQNSLQLTFIQDALVLTHDVLEIECEVELIVRVDGEVYSEPSVFNMSIPIKFYDSPLGSIGSAYVEKIQTKEKRVDSKLANTIQDVGDVLEVTGQACNYVTMAATVYGTFTSAETITTACESFPPSQGPCTAATVALNKVSGGLGEVMNKVLSVGDTSLNLQGILGGGETGKESIFTRACKYATCSAGSKIIDVPWEDAFDTGVIQDLVGDQNDGDGYFGRVLDNYQEDLLTGVGQPDVQESLLASVKAQCIPGIVYHLEKFREMECSQLACYKWAAQLGLNIGVCDQAKANSLCMATYGELSEVLGPTKVGQDVLDNFNAIVQNAIPSAIKNFAGEVACHITEQESFLTKSASFRLPLVVGCKLPKAVAQISYQMSDSAQGNAQFAYPDLSTCDFALCNGDSIEDCADEGTIPPYLQQYMLFNQNAATLPTQEIYDRRALTETQVNNIETLSQFDGDAEKGGAKVYTNDEIALIKLTGFKFDTEQQGLSTAELNKKVSTHLSNFADAQKFAADNKLPMTYTLDSNGVGTFELDSASYSRGEGKTLGDLSLNYQEAARRYDNRIEDLAKKIGSENAELLEFLFSQTGQHVFETSESNVDLRIEVNPETQQNQYVSRYDVGNNQKVTVRHGADGSQDFYLDRGDGTSSKYKTISGSGEETIFIPEDVPRNEPLVIEPIAGPVVPADANAITGTLALGDTVTSMVVGGIDTELRYNPETGQVAVYTFNEDVYQGSITNDDLLDDGSGIQVHFIDGVDPRTFEIIDSSLKLAKTKNQNGIEYQRLKESYIKDIDNALKTETNDEVRESLTKLKEELSGTSNEDLTEEQSLAQLKAKDQALQASVELMANQVAQWAFEQGMLEWMQWDDAIGWDGLDNLNDILNSNQRRTNLCNALVTINSGDSYEGVAIQCDNNDFCVPVLSYAAEKIRYEDGNYLYSANWFVGNVADIDETVPESEKFIRYNVIFKGNGNSDLALHTDSNFAEIPFGQRDERFYENEVISFNSTNNYDKICFVFDKDFPPDGNSGFGRKTEFCRDIQDVESGEFFDISSPDLSAQFGSYGNNDEHPGGFKCGVCGE